MNLTELARQVNIPAKELKEILPELGFDIGKRAIQVDDKIAAKIIQKLSSPHIREKILTPKKENTIPLQKEEAEKKETNLEKKITIGETIVVKKLAEKMNIEVTKLILELMKNGVMASLNQKIDFETACIIAEDFGFRVEKEKGEKIDIEKEKQERLSYFKDDSKNLKPRPPIIVVMGHVDHGKTKLLDAIRQTNIVDTETGGITQHIGAYQVEKSGQLITFIDTPGHEAFSTMRSRGAQVADIAILVVAADDAVKPQTIEAISHIRSAGLPLLVAINKIDKDTANIEKIKSELAEVGLTPEDWGGKTVTTEISAKQKINIDGLLDTLLLIYEMEKDKIVGNKNRGAVGTIIESHIDKGTGPVATCLVQTGTLNQGDIVKIGSSVSKIRNLKNWQNEAIKSAGPSTPAQILGLKKVPQVGEILCEITDKKEIKKLSKLSEKQNYKLINKQNEPKIQKNEEESKDFKKINLILKADVFGSIEAILESLEKIKDKEVEINIIKKALGNINEGDIEQAKDLDAVIIGFNAKPTTKAAVLASNEEVEIKTFGIIYDLIDFVKQKVEQLISPEIITTLLGKIEVIKIFKQDKKEQIIGGKVTLGKILPNSKVNILRKEELVSQGQLKELQCNKEIVTEAVEGQECGMQIETTAEIKEGDVLEFFKEEEKERRL